MRQQRVFDERISAITASGSFIYAISRSGSIYQLDIANVNGAAEPKAKAVLGPDSHCTELLIYKQEQVNLLLCGLSCQSYLIFSLPDFVCKTI